MWVKICGNTTLADAQLAVDAGADALGFIFAKSPRQATPAQAASIIAGLPRNVEKYGVFVDAGFDEIVATVEETGLTGVQIHSSQDPGLALRLREHFAAMPGHPRLGILRVLHFPSEGAGQAAFEAQLSELRADHAVDAVLIDSRTTTAVGGTGKTFDWVAASGSFLKTAPHLRLIAAGGLSPENVAEAIATLRPWGVDVVSGVEASPGKKDAGRVREFIRLARV